MFVFSGNNMNAFLNENWRDVYKEMAPTIEATFEQVTLSLTKSIFDKFSFEELYPKTL